MTLDEFLAERKGKRSRRVTLFRLLVSADSTVPHPQAPLQWSVLWAVVQGLYDVMLACPRLPNSGKDPDPAHWKKPKNPQNP